jgi:putative phosphoribosyl transferase
MRTGEERRVEERPMRIPYDGIALEADLALPANAVGVVLFAHGSGSSRFSRRNQAVARRLQDAGFATLLLDLLTAEEEKAEARTGHFRFDIEMLSLRLAAATNWVLAQRDLEGLPVGYFGASTGAAAAIVAAAMLPHVVSAVVSRGGRPDLAGSALGDLRAPTLLIVGGFDTVVMNLNHEALRRLRCICRLEIVPRAGHLFEESGALEKVADLARQWFTEYLVDRYAQMRRLPEDVGATADPVFSDSLRYVGRRYDAEQDVSLHDENPMDLPLSHEGGRFVNRTIRRK